MDNQPPLFAQAAQKNDSRGPARLAMASQKNKFFGLGSLWLTPENILILVFFFIFLFILSQEAPRNPLMLIINVLILVIMGCLVSYTKIKDILLIYRSPASPIYALPTSGRFEIAGKAQGDPIISPISEGPCLFWQVEIKEKQGRYWVTIYQDACHEPFEIQDETSKVKIFTNNAKFILANAMQESSGSFSHLSDRTLIKLQQINIKTKGVLGFARSLKVYERLIRPDQPIHALGKIQELDKMTSFSDRMSFSIISDRMKRDLLSKLYLQVALRLGLSLLIGGWLIVAILYT